MDSNALMVILFVYSVKKSIWCHVQHANWSSHPECYQEIRFWKILQENILETLRIKNIYYTYFCILLYWSLL